MINKKSKLVSLRDRHVILSLPKDVIARVGVRSNLTVLKRFTAILILLILSVFLSAPTVYAENEKLRVYYSEPIGAGEKVYKLTACNWVRVYEPLVCSEENADQYSAQCKYKEGDKKGEVKKGTRIMGCTKEEDNGEKYEDDAKMYLKADVQKYDNGGCKDDPTLQDYKYGPVWAIVDSSITPDSPSKWILKDKVATGKVDEKPSDEIIKKNYKSGSQNDAYPFFKTNLCATWDVVPDLAMYDDDTANKTIKVGGKNLNILKNIIKPEGEAGELIAKGCNNDNTETAYPIVTGNGTSPIPLVHCSLVERITGDTGTDIFSQYVGALYKWAAGIVGIVTVLIMVFSGIQISMAGGDSAKIDSAKNRIMQSIIGLVILFLAGLILYTINPGFFTG